ncbi:MAG: CRISPR-Cas type I system-associated endonuclease/helicase Cas3 [Thermodesulfobacterium sp.]|uniref:CRISPR-Cas type I system-associated endonuclease/helicase Cas3 n=1 Tax=Candidatus Thermodesulfobacterium syntrophicum TaxID=3060442 RepID=A0AAE3P0U0_9BACT|nr:CRISPR-Cas type I system-associated endonuclease/helicase Cas3 [Candidatus Thermodesulfobacterium syntrophicum]
MELNIQLFNKELIARKEQRLESHLKEVMENGISILRRNLKEKFPVKEEILKAGFFFHDVGKSEISIQKALYEDKKSPISHTHLSVIFFYAWLRDFLKKDLYELLQDEKLRIISFSILSHHSAPHRELENNIFSQILNKKIVIAKEIFDILKKYKFTLSEDTLKDTYKKFIEGYKENIYEFRFDSILTPKLRKNFSFFYNALVKGDWYSAIRTEIPRVKPAFEIIDPKVFLYPNKSKFHKYIYNTKDFKENILLELPTGFGKTFLGLAYALKTKRNKILYTLPVTTIIEDVYENSLKKYIDENQLEWYTSKYLVLKSLKKGDLEESAYLEAKYFEKSIIITTLDQLLFSFLGVDRYPLKEALIYDSCIILDEPQLYSPLMLFLFSEFLKDYKDDLNVIIMSATLPEFLKEKVKEYFIEPFDQHVIKSIFERFNRVNIDISYLGFLISNLQLNSELQKNLRKLLSQGKKIAFIFNTVKKAQNFYNSLPIDFPKYLFHARYIYKDRVRKLMELKNKLNENPIVVVSTQAIEAGVNVSFDVMFRELAPFDSIIQSAGRVNRFNENFQPCSVYVFGDENDYLPYKKELLKITKEILMNLKIRSELDLFINLREYWEKTKNYLYSAKEKANKLYESAKELRPFAIDLEEEKINLRDAYFKISVIPIQFYDEIKKLWEKYRSFEKKNFWERKKILTEIESYIVEVPFLGKIGNRNFKDYLQLEEKNQFINLKYDPVLGLLPEEELIFYF